MEVNTGDLFIGNLEQSTTDNLLVMKINNDLLGIPVKHILNVSKDLVVEFEV